MTLFVCLQLFFDLVATGCLVAWFFLRFRENEDSYEDPRAAAALQVLETRTRQLELDAQQYRVRMDAQIARLSKLCDAASRILERNSLEVLEPTTEQKDLQSALQVRDEIPSLRQLEKTKARLHSELRVDLKSLLSEQLM